MKNYLRYFCLRLVAAAFLASVPAYAFSQVKITVSDQIVSVKGEKMYVHNVKKGETIYSICKAYKITADELQRHNPVISAGLKEGQILYIPVSGLRKSDGQDSEKQQVAPSGNENRQVVPAGNENQPSEILKKYDTDNYISHKVRLLENLDDIAEKYGVEKEAIMAFNGLKSEKVRKIKWLNIPMRKSASPYTIVSENNPDTLDNNRIFTQTDTVLSASSDSSDTAPFRNYTMPEIDRSKTRVVALLLPLNNNGKANANYMDFYSGALMALEQIKLSGGNIKLNVLDYGDNISSIALSEKIEEADLVIGPIRYEALKEIVPVANRLKIPVVSPLDAAADSLLPECPYLFQAALSPRRQMEALADMVIQESAKAPNPNIIIVYSPSSKDAPGAEMLKEILEEKGASVTSCGGTASLSAIRNNMDNIVIVQSYTEGLTAEILRQIDIKMVPPERMTLFGTPKWKGFEALDMNLYFKYNTKICMPYNVDLNREDVRQFIRAYRSLYGCEPRANAFSGYDIVYFFCKSAIGGLRECAEYPDNNIATGYMEQNLLQLDLLQQKFKFVRNPEGGYVNTAATMISFNPDYTVTTEN